MAEKVFTEEEELTFSTHEKLEKILPQISPYYAAKKARFPRGEKSEIAEEEHTLIYDSASETLEPVYFWLLEFMQSIAGKVEKITDNFTSSPGSGHFSELMGKATVMQKEAMNIMSTLNVLVKSIINIIYDLRDWQIRLSPYKNLISANKEERGAAELSLKQMWMDNVDIKRGIGSINAMTTGNLNFVTLRDAFMVVNKLEEIDDMDLNERVKRILKARLAEYLKWEEMSGKELAKRYSIERTYLKSQVDSLKLYTRWVRPYLLAAGKLQQKEILSPELVTAFNMVLLELSLFGKKELRFDEEIIDKRLPPGFKGKNLKRKYYFCNLVDFRFRGLPQRVGQHYAFGGKVTVNFRAYALNEQELKLLKKKMEDEDMKEALKLAQGMTEDSLEQIKEDIEEFLGETDEEKKEEEKSEDTDPFTALFKPMKKKEEKVEEVKKVKLDNYLERTVRALTVKEAKRTCFKLFDVYKKTHGMPSHDNPYEQIFIPTED